jgi:hypothetical protein
MTVAGTPASLRATVVGQSGSGKTVLLRELFVRRAARVITVDITGEWFTERGTTPVGDFAELVTQLRRLAGRASWHLVVPFDPAEREQLAALLIGESGAGRASALSLALGGVALNCDELADFADQAAPPLVRALWQRGRHAGLSIFGASQRPAQVNRIVTANSQWLGICRVAEPLDLAYVRRATAPAVVAQLEQLPPYGAVLWDNVARRGYVLNAKRERVRDVGAAAPPAAPVGDLLMGGRTQRPPRARPARAD